MSPRDMVGGPPAGSSDLPPVVWLSPAAAMSVLDRVARRWQGISSAEFLARWEQGGYAGREDDPGVLDVALQLYVQVIQRYGVFHFRRTVPQRWLMRAVEYKYQALRRPDGDEALRFDWHPQTTPAFRHRHLHVVTEAGAAAPAAHRRPVITRLITLEHFIRLLIDQYQVEPVRAEWQGALRATETTFSRSATWRSQGSLADI